MTFEQYLKVAFNALGNSNMIPIGSLDNAVKIGLYYLMSIYGLAFKHCTYGSWEWIMLVDKDGEKGLNAEEILSRPINQEMWVTLKQDCDNGILPGQEPEKRQKTHQEFGWLTPTGEFIQSCWGNHEEEAFEQIKSRGFEDEFFDHKHREGTVTAAGDFLSQVKGWCLIHNPSMDGGYVVTHIKPLTKHQREFLYNYFKEIGNTFRAESYLQEDAE